MVLLGWQATRSSGSSIAQGVMSILGFSLENVMFYTGIGSRETPREVMITMYLFAMKMAEQGLTLRSGGADGADTAFECGADKRQGSPSYVGKKEIYLPWVGFNGRSSQFTKPSNAAYDLASEIHPAWFKCSRGMKALHARNCHQILGMDLNSPSSFVVCWTPGGKLVGGTRTALVLASLNNIPVFNLFIYDIAMIERWLKK